MLPTSPLAPALAATAVAATALKVRFKHIEMASERTADGFVQHGALVGLHMRHTVLSGSYMRRLGNYVTVHLCGAEVMRMHGADAVQFEQQAEHVLEQLAQHRPREGWGTAHGRAEWLAPYRAKAATLLQKRRQEVARVASALEHRGSLSAAAVRAEMEGSSARAAA